MTKTGQHGSGSPRPPKTSHGCKSFILAIRDRSGLDERRLFFPKLLCLARMSSNVTKTGQHGSGSPRPPKTSLGCKCSILAIRARSGPDEQGPLDLPKLHLVAKVQFWQFATGPHLSNRTLIFKAALPSSNVE